MKALIFGGNSLVRYTAVALLAVGMNMAPMGDASAARVAAGSTHTLAIKGDGTVWGWGHNYYGQLGNVTTTQTPTPLQVTGLTRITAVSANSYSSAAVKSNGTVWAWGNGISLTPVAVSGLTNAIEVAAADPAYGGGAKFVALKSDGTVWTWSYSAGVNTAPVQVTGLANIKAIDKGYHALRSDGTVWTWGYSGATQTAPVMQAGLASVRAIAVGAAHTLALKIDGTVWAWGNNALGQLGNGTLINSVTPVQVVGLSNIKSIAASDFQARNVVQNGTASQAVKADGTVWMWGSNSHGQIHAGVNVGGIFNLPRQIVQGYALTDPPILANIEAAAGPYHAISLKSDGYALAWGENSSGQGGTGNYSGLSVPLVPTQVVTTF